MAAQSPTNVLREYPLPAAAQVKESSPTAPGNPADLLGAYILDSGDRIKIEVFNVPELSGEFDISVDGTLNLPWVGTLSVQGQTVSELKKALQEQYSQFVNRPPVINLRLLIPRPIRVAVAGEVYRPGTYLIDFGGEPNRTKEVYRFPTVTQLIQKAGGITQVANVRNIQIRRFTGSNQPQVIDVDLWKLIQAGDIAQDVSLRDGDTIMISTASQVDLGEAVRLGRVNFAPDKINVQVVGEVVTPGSVSVPPNTSMNQAILTAGGFKNGRARVKAVELIRLNPDGTVKRQTISVNFAAQPNDLANPLLQPNDVIIAKRSATASLLDTFGTIFTPLSALTSILYLFR
ncbi:MAG: SLBB domain-containing protein [Tildeniella nuda ZEHNDER 1965/U140]|nr:SLBB domain-containing protein [Tildeniella nuda ZEHNDER 1965/U140]